MKAFVFGGLLAASLMTASAASAITIVNGGFENGVSGSWFSRHSAGSDAIPGWTIDRDTIDWSNGIWISSEGFRSVDLDGNIGHAGSVSQLVTDLTVGQRYRISFDLAGNPDRGPAIKPLQVSVGGEASRFTFDITGASRSGMNWVTQAIEFVASDTSAMLRFESLTLAETGSAGYGAVIDNVRGEAFGSSVAPVPLPAAGWMLVAGLGGLAAMRRRAR